MGSRLFATLGITAALLLTGQLFAAPKNVERYSTDPDDRDLKKFTVNGEITSIRGQEAVLRTDQGERVTVHLGPRWYWDDKGYQIRSGVRATVSGWGEYEDGGYMFAGLISGPGFYVELWDSDGYPRWANGRDRWDRRPSYRWCDDYYRCDPPRHHYYRSPPRWVHVDPWPCPPPRHHYRHDHHRHGRCR